MHPRLACGTFTASAVSPHQEARKGYVDLPDLETFSNVTGLLAGLWGFPTVPFNEDVDSREERSRELYESLMDQGLASYELEKHDSLDVVPHIYTHISMSYYPHLYVLRGGLAPPAIANGIWHSESEARDSNMGLGFKKSFLLSTNAGQSEITTFKATATSRKRKAASPDIRQRKLAFTTKDIKPVEEPLQTPSLTCID